MANRQDVKETVQSAAQNTQWVDNGDGTKTKTIAFAKESRNGKGSSGDRKITRTVRAADNILVKLEASFKQTLPQGGSHALERTKVLQEDGSYVITFRSVIVNAAGQVRLVEWSKTISVSGDVTGSGTLVVRSGKDVSKSFALTFSGNETTQTVTVEEGGIKTEVTLPAEGLPQATVVTETGQRNELPIEASEDGTVAPAEFITRPTTDASDTPAEN